MTSWPIYIPSRGRPDSKLVRELAGRAYVVVEPHQAAAYLASCPGGEFIVLAADNQGIAYVRNAVLNHARASGAPWFWSLDDDIQAFYTNTPKQKPAIVEPAQALKMGEEALAKLGHVGQAALEYQQFAWSGKKQWSINSYCDVAVAVNVAATKRCHYRAEANLKEDRDFTLQVLKAGWRTARYGGVGFRAPANGSNAGGLAEVYAQPNNEVDAVETMVRLWPGVVTKQVKPNGRVDCKINWKLFK